MFLSGLELLMARQTGLWNQTESRGNAFFSHLQASLKQQSLEQVNSMNILWLFRQKEGLQMMSSTTFNRKKFRNTLVLKKHQFYFVKNYHGINAVQETLKLSHLHTLKLFSKPRPNVGQNQSEAEKSH